MNRTGEDSPKCRDPHTADVRVTLALCIGRGGDERPSRPFWIRRQETSCPIRDFLGGCPGGGGGQPGIGPREQLPILAAHAGRGPPSARCCRLGLLPRFLPKTGKRRLTVVPIWPRFGPARPGETPPRGMSAGWPVLGDPTGSLPPGSWRLMAGRLRHGAFWSGQASFYLRSQREADMAGPRAGQDAPFPNNGRYPP